MTQYARPDGDVSLGDWVDPDSGTEDLYLTINEVEFDDDDYIFVEQMMPDTTESIFTLSDVTDPSSSSDHTVYYRAKSDSFGRTLRVRLYETTTERASSDAFTPTGSFVNYSFTLTTAEADSIDNYNNLRLGFSASGEDPDEVYISQAWFACPEVAASSTSNPQSFSLVKGGAMGTSFSLIGDIDVSPKVRI